MCYEIIQILKYNVLTKDTGRTRVSVNPQSKTNADDMPTVNNDTRWLGAKYIDGTFK